jgi:hypothetical protein
MSTAVFLFAPLALYLARMYACVALHSLLGGQCHSEEAGCVAHLRPPGTAARRMAPNDVLLALRGGARVLLQWRGSAIVLRDFFLQLCDLVLDAIWA